MQHFIVFKSNESIGNMGSLQDWSGIGLALLAKWLWWVSILARSWSKKITSVSSERHAYVKINMHILEIGRRKHNTIKSGRPRRSWRRHIKPSRCKLSAKEKHLNKHRTANRHRKISISKPPLWKNSGVKILYFAKITADTVCSNFCKVSRNGNGANHKNSKFIVRPKWDRFFFIERPQRQIKRQRIDFDISIGFQIVLGYTTHFPYEKTKHEVVWISIYLE